MLLEVITAFICNGCLYWSANKQVNEITLVINS